MQRNIFLTKVEVLENGDLKISLDVDQVYNLRNRTRHFHGMHEYPEILHDLFIGTECTFRLELLEDPVKGGNKVLLLVWKLSEPNKKWVFTITNNSYPLDDLVEIGSVILFKQISSNQ